MGKEHCSFKSEVKLCNVMMYNKYIVLSSYNDDTSSYSVVDVKTDNPIKDWSEDKLITYGVVQDMLRSFSGRILTIIDASIPEGKQNKSVKDLIRSEFVLQYEKFADLMLDQKKILEEVDRLTKDSNIHLCSNEEILRN